MVFALVKTSEAAHSFPLDHVGTSGQSIKPRLQVLPIENDKNDRSSQGSGVMSLQTKSEEKNI